MKPLSALLLLVLASCGPGSGTASPSDRAPATGDIDVPQVETTARRVWAGPDVDFLGSPTPDGRFLTHVDWNGDLALRDLTTGESRVLAGKAAGRDFRFALTSRVSPDGRQVAFVCGNQRLEYELRVVGIDGSGERTLLQNDRHIDYLEVHGWSPDGTRILVVLTFDDGSNRIALVPADGGELALVRSLDWRWPMALDHSPDGRHLAYDLPRDRDSTRRDVFVLTLHENREEPLTEGPADHRLLGWSPKGDGLLVASDQESSRAIWRLPLALGRPAGKPSLVRRDAWGVQPLGRSREAVFYGVTVQDTRVHTATLDPEGGATEPTPLSDLSLGRATSPAWSPDGAYLAYAVQGDRPGADRIMIYALQEGAVREVPGPVGRVRRVTWSPDGRTLVLVGSHRGRGGFYTVDLASGEIRRLAPAASGPFVQVVPVLSPDGGTLYHYRYEPDSRRLAIVALELATGRERLVLAGASDGTLGLALSPDGRRLAWVGARGSVFVLPVEGGEARLVYQLATDEISGRQALTWTPDGRALLYATRSRADETDQKLYRIHPEGGEPELLGQGDGFAFVRVHPDGRRIAYVAGEFLGEVWVLEEPVQGAAATADGGR